MDLALRYYNAMILVHFPCLSRRDAAQCSSECLNAARSIIAHILHHTDNGIAELLPWWCLLHYLVCAEVVVMLFIVQHDNLDFCYQLMEEVRRPLQWVKMTGEADLAAQRTEIQLGQLLGHVQDMLAERRRRSIIEEGFGTMIRKPF
jgi:hypothetical protein